MNQRSVVRQGLSVRQMAVVGILGAFAVVLGLTPLGFIPMPTGVNATTMHLPAILAAIVEGPVVGALVGLIFGLHSWIAPRAAFFADPLVAILPRVLIGVVSYYVFRATRSVAAAAVAGTVTNTVGVLGLIVLRFDMALAWAGTVALTHGIPEVIVAVVIMMLIVKALRPVYKDLPTTRF